MANLIDLLTAREHEALAFLAEGKSNRAIALRMNISEHTIKIHVRRVLTKLEVHNRTQAAAFYHCSGSRKSR